jgi:hypothetical protein
MDKKSLKDRVDDYLRDVHSMVDYVLAGTNIETAQGEQLDRLSELIMTPRCEDETDVELRDRLKGLFPAEMAQMKIDGMAMEVETDKFIHRLREKMKAMYGAAKEK